MPIFRQNGKLWLFWPKFAQKWILGSEFWKTKCGCRISSSKIPCVPISKQNKQLRLFWPKFAQKNWFCGQNFKNLSPESESVSPRYHLGQFSDKTDNFNFLSPNWPKNWFWGWNFEILSLDLESAPPIYHECQFSGKRDNFEIFGLNLGKFPNYVWYFGSYNIEGVTESCVEAKMSWVEVEMGWVEMDGGGCTVY